jgi:hypothetical protein
MTSVTSTHHASSSAVSRWRRARPARPRINHDDRALRQPKLENLQAAVLKLESGKTFDASDSDSQQNRIDTGDKISSFFQEETKVSGIDDQNRVDEIEANLEVKTI